MRARCRRFPEANRREALLVRRDAVAFDSQTASSPSAWRVSAKAQLSRTHNECSRNRRRALCSCSGNQQAKPGARRTNNELSMDLEESYRTLGLKAGASLDEARR